MERRDIQDNQDENQQVDGAVSEDATPSESAGQMSGDSLAGDEDSVAEDEQVPAAEAPAIDPADAAEAASHALARLTPESEAAEEALESLSDLSGVAAMATELEGELSAQDAFFAAEAARAASIADEAATGKTTLIPESSSETSSLTSPLPGHSSVPHVDETIMMKRAGEVPQRLSQLPRNQRPGRHPMSPHKKLAIGLAVVLALGVAGFGGYELYLQREAQASQQAAASVQDVTIAVNVAGLSTSSSEAYGAVGSKIPVQVSGQDANGSIVDQIAYMDEKGQGIRLMPGDYTLTVAASPIAVDGTIYQVPDTKLQLKVIAGTSDYTKAGSFDFVAASAADVTDGAIKDAYKYASEGGVPSDAVAQILRDVATARRDTARDAASKQQAELQKEADDLHKATNSYSLDLPRSWYGRVQTAQNGNDLYVYQADTNALVCQLSVQKDGTAAPSSGTAVLATASLGNGASVVVSGPVYAQLLPQISAGKASRDAVKGLTDKQIEELVLLQTGMSYSYEEIDRGIAGKNAGDDAEIKITQDYITQTLASSIKAS